MKRMSRGFTLVETIFSTLFISLTVLAIVNLFPGAYMSVKKSETRLQSDIIAQSIIEELREVRFNDLPPEKILDGLSRTAASDPNSYEYESLQVDGTRYFPTVTLYELADTDPEIVRGVRVEIGYQTRAGESSGSETKIHDGTRYYINQRNVHDTILHSLR